MGLWDTRQASPDACCAVTVPGGDAVQEQAQPGVGGRAGLTDLAGGAVRGLRVSPD